MRKIKIVVFILYVFNLVGCASYTENFNGDPIWDFDHQLQYTQVKRDDNTYYVEVIPNDRIRFSKISAFILRKGFRICRGYGFKVTVLKGIEGFDHKRSFPNMITARFSANIECTKADS